MNHVYKTTTVLPGTIQIKLYKIFQGKIKTGYESLKCQHCVKQETKKMLQIRRD
jgi:hypothetical protein